MVKKHEVILAAYGLEPSSRRDTILTYLCDEQSPLAFTELAKQRGISTPGKFTPLTQMPRDNASPGELMEWLREISDNVYVRDGLAVSISMTQIRMVHGTLLVDTRTFPSDIIAKYPCDNPHDHAPALRFALIHRTNTPILIRHYDGIMWADWPRGVHSLKWGQGYAYHTAGKCTLICKQVIDKS